MMENNKRIKVWVVCLAVVFVGLALFDLGISYMYREELNKESCDLCFELNPGLENCSAYKPINFSYPLVSYGK